MKKASQRVFKLRYCDLAVLPWPCHNDAAVFRFLFSRVLFVFVNSRWANCARFFGDWRAIDFMMQRKRDDCSVALNILDSGPRWAVVWSRLCNWIYCNDWQLLHCDVTAWTGIKEQTVKQWIFFRIYFTALYRNGGFTLSDKTACSAVAIE